MKTGIRFASALILISALFLCTGNVTSGEGQSLAFPTLRQSPTATAPQSAASPLSRPYRILVTNDDGVRAPGLIALATALRTVGDVTVIAPAENQSAKSHSLTQADPIYVDSVTWADGTAATAVSATPATCVKVAIASLMPQRPDIVVSGINPGYNLGMVAYVSGTVAAAREGALQDIPAVAISLNRTETNFSAAAQVAAEIVDYVKSNGLPAGTFLNVGVPAGSRAAFKGIRLTRQSGRSGGERYEEGKTPWGRRFLWDVYSDPGTDVEGTDLTATASGFVSVTPLHVGEFDAGATKRLEGLVR
jgi:5'-nucleotidase